MCYKKFPAFKALLSVFILLILSDLLHAQNSLSEARIMIEKSKNIQKSGMIVLGSWAVLNIFSGTAGHFLSEGRQKYFHQMNAGWGAVNLAIAGFSYASLSGIDPIAADLNNALRQAINLDKILLLNAGLDLGYIAAGAWLNERGLKKNSERLRGYGTSLMIQGGFLLVFDAVLYTLHSPITDDLIQISTGFNAQGISLSLVF